MLDSVRIQPNLRPDYGMRVRYSGQKECGLKRKGIPEKGEWLLEEGSY